VKPRSQNVIVVPRSVWCAMADSVEGRHPRPISAERFDDGSAAGRVRRAHRFETVRPQCFDAVGEFGVLGAQHELARSVGAGG
jgi:hypothetical protein